VDAEEILYKAKQNIECEVCYETVDLSIVITLPCNHKLDIYCLKNQLAAMQQQGKSLDEFVCFLSKDECLRRRKLEHPNFILSHDELKRQMIPIMIYHLGENYFENTFKQYKRINKNIRLCECNEDHDFSDFFDKPYYLCPNTNDKKCKLCLKSLHSGNCRFSEILVNLNPANWPLD